MIESTFKPLNIITGLSDKLAGQEDALKSHLNAVTSSTNQAQLLKLQVDFQQYLHCFTISATITKSIHDTQSEIIRKF